MPVNLLHNAAKYTECGGDISMTASGTDAETVVTVTDTGAGIPPAMLPRIFDMYMQLQPHRDRTLGGLGIGLSLAKRLVELHDGVIEASSEGPGRGSRFSVRLPAASPAPNGEPAPAPERATPPADCRVLIAEDNADAAEMMQMMLQMKGYDVRVAKDGTDAVAIAALFEPHIAFLDIGMPVMDGYEAARRIREMLGARVVLVALTGWGQDEDKRRSLEAGFDHHLTKPPDPEVVDRLIADCGGRR